jgi:ClpP class serine protease
VAPKAWGQDVEVLLMGGVGGAKAFREEGEMAVVDICGPLTQHGGGFFFDSYDGIRTRVAAACASDKPAVCLALSSPGGDFAGCLELGREIRAMCAASSKLLFAFTDSEALSAAYALASVAEEIAVTPSAFVGSIGIWAPLVDQTGADKMMGQAVVIVASGTRKADRNPHVAISEGAVKALQEQVDAQAAIFFSHVAEYRGIAVAKVEALEGAPVMGTGAVAAGLADVVVNSWAEYVAQAGGPSASSKGKTMSKYDEALGAMRRAAEEDSEDGKKAKRALKAMEEDNEPAKDKEEKKEAKAEGEGEEKEKEKAKAKGKAEGEEEPEKDKEEKAKASADSGLEAIRLVHELRSSLNAKAEAEERTSLLASRPDFDDTVRGFLAKQPIAAVREAVNTFARSSRRFAPAAGSQTMGATVGATQGDLDIPLDAESERLISRAMGDGAPVPFSVGCGDLSAAREFLKKQAAAAAKGV